MKRYNQIGDIIARVTPISIVEIGTHKGVRARYMTCEALRHVQTVHYIGFDVFETESAAFHNDAMNGKGIATRAVAEGALQGVARQHRGRLTWELVTGDTRKTLAGREIVADLVFIDGDHRVETIRSDFDAVRSSRCVIFDDVYLRDEAGQMPDIDTYGANLIVSQIPNAVLLPVVDPCRAGGMIKLAVVG